MGFLNVKKRVRVLQVCNSADNTNQDTKHAGTENSAPCALHKHGFVSARRPKHEKHVNLPHAYDLHKVQRSQTLFHISEYLKTSQTTKCQDD